MKRVGILVEGQTEDAFVRDILSDYLLTRNVALSSRIAATDRATASRGGITSYGKVRFDLRQMIHNFDFVTTFIDFYGLRGKNFPGFDTIPAEMSIYDKVRQAEQRWFDDIVAHTGQRNFIPYMTIHEFEALLLASPEDVVANKTPKSGETYLEKIGELLKSYDSPEEINEQTPPSKHLESIFGAYDKVNDGLMIAVDIGVDAIRQTCRHFDEWLQKLEQIGEQSDD